MCKAGALPIILLCQPWRCQLWPQPRHLLCCVTLAKCLALSCWKGDRDWVEKRDAVSLTETKGERQDQICEGRYFCSHCKVWGTQDSRLEQVPRWGEGTPKLWLRVQWSVGQCGGLWTAPQNLSSTQSLHLDMNEAEAARSWDSTVLGYRDSDPNPQSWGAGK